MYLVIKVFNCFSKEDLVDVVEKFFFEFGVFFEKGCFNVVRMYFECCYVCNVIV